MAHVRPPVRPKRKIRKAEDGQPVASTSRAAAATTSHRSRKRRRSTSSSSIIDLTNEPEEANEKRAEPSVYKWEWDEDMKRNTSFLLHEDWLLSMVMQLKSMEISSDTALKGRQDELITHVYREMEWLEAYCQAEWNRQKRVHAGDQQQPVQEEINTGKNYAFPARTYLHQEMKSWMAQLLSRPGMEKIMDTDVWDASLFPSFRGPDGSSAWVNVPLGEGRYLFSLSVDSFNPFYNKEVKQQEHRRLAEQWKSKTSVKVCQETFDKNGVWWSELLRLPYWDPILFTVIDTMHNQYLGLLKTHCRDVWGMKEDMNDGDGIYNSKHKVPARPPDADMLQGLTYLHRGTPRELSLCKKAVLWHLAFIYNLRWSNKKKVILKTLLDWNAAFEWNEINPDQSLDRMDIFNDRCGDTKLDTASIQTLPPVLEDRTGDRDTMTAVLGCETLRQIHVDLARTKLPSWINPAPANLGTSEQGKLHADQWLTACMINFPITLIRLWGVESAMSRKRDAAKATLEYITSHLHVHQKSMKVQTLKGNYLTNLTVHTELVNFDGDEGSWKWNMDDLILHAAILPDCAIYSNYLWVLISICYARLVARRVFLPVQPQQYPIILGFDLDKSMKVQTSKGNYLTNLAVRTELVDFDGDEGSWEQNMDDLILHAAILPDPYWLRSYWDTGMPLGCM
ncbi:hypothetical protein WOLCODRAFT_148486 [Wolfiporia cocos MD-104 SS10]|uniref:Uncharacterized protein n=1 Tax=Wolfiporia cocos (strain MD-104) TaxID=742152 RepID=A0A2H3J3T1_WOLCO|nr:hypothetical protein WOLCODRAFT_148486 [Wolfiporia cocos MD-104 SS10]